MIAEIIFKNFKFSKMPKDHEVIKSIQKFTLEFYRNIHFEQLGVVVITW